MSVASSKHHPRIVLASASQTRQDVLAAAGLSFAVQPADVDEDQIRNRWMATGAEPADIAQRLADAKARQVSARRPHAVVIGADQILARGREVFCKPPDMAAARTALRQLCGRTHHLHSAVTLAIDGNSVWQHVDTAQLTMRAFSSAFLDDYLIRAGPKVCESVGSYQLEGLGVQLFERIEGDYFTVLGLPLLPLLDALRARGELLT